MSYDQDEARHEYEHDIKRSRVARARAKALRRMKSPKAKEATSKAKTLTKDVMRSYSSIPGNS